MRMRRYGPVRRCRWKWHGIGAATVADGVGRTCGRFLLRDGNILDGIKLNGHDTNGAVPAVHAFEFLVPAKPLLDLFVGDSLAAGLAKVEVHTSRDYPAGDAEFHSFV